ncbi:MAG: hypothetical protein IJ520_08000 [Synergistaceae bacterium]|nr:hypothetical protein [Synergistaceae bacterium]
MNNKIKAAVDIGSNSIKMRAGRINNGRIEVLRDMTEVVRLGKCFVNNNFIPDEIMNNAVRVICGMIGQARALGAEICDIKLVGTMALRMAENSGEFINRVKAKTGLEINIISGEEEARLSWRGAAADFDFNKNNDLVMFDTVGGRTEFVVGDINNIRQIQSVPVGAVSLSEKFFKSEIVKPEVFNEAENYVAELLNLNLENFKNLNSPDVIGLGGGVVAMASVKNACEIFIPTVLHGSVLTQKDLARQIKLYASLSLSERQNIVGLPPSRADVILGSACIVLCALKFIGVNFCRVSINGLRHGVLTEMLL